MENNKYDEQSFFDKYSEMERSKNGLVGAGEWETLKKLLPPFKDKVVLDLGCGYGWHCDYAAKNGAKEVLGLDISKKMLEIARHNNDHKNVTYLNCSMEEMELADNHYDIVICSLAFHYIDNISAVFAKISKALKKGGSFVFTVEHPVFTSEGSQQWLTNDDGTIKCFPVDNYFIEGQRKAIFLGEEVIKYHRTITSYTKLVIDNCFTLVNIVEPQPSEDAIKKNEMMKDELRRPMMIIYSCIKN